MKYAAYFLLATLALAGCSTTDTALGQKECQQVDWRQVGLTDGLAGELPERVLERKGDCERFDVALDPEQYTEGYIEGIRRYCTYEGGYAAAERGRKYLGACPAPLEETFAEGYREGWKVYVAREKMERVKRKIDSQQSGTGGGGVSGADSGF